MSDLKTVGILSALVGKPALEALADAGRIARNSIVTFARSGIAMAVRKETPKPSIETGAVLRTALIDAQSIAYPDPGGGHLSGLRFQDILAELGITKKIAFKAKLIDGTLADFALRHEVEIAITQPMEILATRDYGLVGALPHKFQDDENFT